MDLLCGQPIPDEPKIPCSIVIEDGHGELQYEGPVGVEKRGRSSQAFPKPQYGVELWVGPAEDASANLLGMGRDSDWILNGAWIDRALFRNKLAYDLFQSFGGPERFAPESAFCELTLDDEWRGEGPHVGARVRLLFPPWGESEGTVVKYLPPDGDDIKMSTHFSDTTYQPTFLTQI